VDMRSDTVTKPTPRMREAMANAEVGDDVFGDDPTVISLEERVAEMFGKEAALFVPTGTMSNLICIMSHCFERGSEYVVGDEAHVYIYEQGGAATLGGSHPRTVPTQADGRHNLEDLEKAIRADDQHFPVTKVICLENTHNLKGGEPLPASYIDEVGALCKRRGLALHVDGARIWHAAAYHGETLQDLAKSADSLSVCLSKGLGAPAGSLVVGSFEFIKRSRRLRKVLGGTMRQSGVLAAAGLVGLDDILPKLHLDHLRADKLAAMLGQVPFLHVQNPKTNLVYATLLPTSPLSAKDLVSQLDSRFNVKCLAVAEDRVRFVLHHQVSDEGVHHAVESVRS
ncbi:pyridoxal phosphate-dependent transferase, partial [Pelagophyceae sp. CCMP2097]